MSFIVEAEIIHNHKVAEGCYSLAFRAPEIAESAQPGQFVHLRCSRTFDPLLRRPLGIQGIDRRDGLVKVLYQVVGKGTGLLSGFEPGSRVNVLGPLGCGFTLPAGARRVALIAGGLGIAPLCFLYETLAEQRIEAVVFHGVRSAGQALAPDLLPPVADRVLMAADDGSLGYHGSVVKLFETYAGQEPFDFFFAAGPSPMLRALSIVAKEYHLPGEVSLEERMGCGIGACLCCNCRTRGEDGWRYSRVCADGPVFPVEEVVWP
ncbi:MAG: dihydroorotate dehydrogenase electron transfer subunit [Desulforudis sp.]|nr:dihydroorotate dehydrogenase electron transfer subunit [Clostridia bacterium]RJX22665.1 MAG: dihydroorotate dehydrogenase electron transfer subunit [Desulforudis sp.]